MTEAARLVLHGGRVADPATRRADHADVLIEGDTIVAVEPTGALASCEAQVIDATDRLLIPGLINAHCHAHGTLGKGLIGDRWPLELLLNINPAITGHRSTEDKYLSGVLGAIEMVRRGCTAAYDLFLELPTPTPEGLQAVGRAYADVGMRAVIAPMMADRTLYQALPGLIDAFPEPLRSEVAQLHTAPYEASVEAARCALRTWPFDRTRIAPALAPTIPLHCSDAFLVACRDLAREFEVGIQTHLAESRTQAVLGLRRYGRSLTAHLETLGLLGPHFSAAHAIWVDDDDIGRLAAAGASVVHNPLSNMRLGSGLAALRPMLERGVRVGLATDGANSSDTLNMFEVMRLAAYVSRVQTPESPRWLGADEVFTMATAGSAAVLRLESRLGRIAPGYKADVVLLDLGATSYVPLNDPITQLVFGENGGAVERVMIGGRLVLDRGRLLTVDESAIRRRVENTAERLRAATAEARSRAGRLEEIVGRFCTALAREPYHVHRLTDRLAADGQRSAETPA